ncbi:glucose-6-phosphate dehydrogenase [Leifsonia shinshuensis]|uniref:glucose-6-phosphate dehydrogenase n=1 Tax=Leifsonia shinshuensis TaxID=150026 RepID=UPI00285EED03|nr:glucose-6-phosphate dehydrogenase [Leifsonia shinshuensis]MDR6970125.1 glucose-6-phosphate 1-dehydrogenase [Leifsonia shinshuensis]
MTQSVDTLVILGASGDLTSRLLLPAIGQLLTDQPDRAFALVGSSSADLDDDAWKKIVRTSFATVEAKGDAVERLLDGTRYVKADATSADDLKQLLGSADGVPALYFALPPAVTAKACQALGTFELPKGLTLALEKPFGTDRESAIALNAQLAKLVPEDQIHRVDHFLGRSSVLNILGVRFANGILEPIWDGLHIERVDVIYDETLALEGRAGYYDGAGALIDMIQSHLLQVMAVLAMEPPSTLGAPDLRDAKQLVLRATKVWGDDPVASSRRARYGAGEIEGRTLPAYADEKGVDPSRETETLAEVTLQIDTWRWKGVPFTLRSGKALGGRRREMVITFAPARQMPVGLKGTMEPAKLRLMFAPDSMELELNINGTDDPYELERTTLTADFGPGALLAYGEVLEGILDGDPSLSVRADTAVECWRIVEPVLDAWRQGRVPLEEYPAGSDGPKDWAPLG